MPGAARIMQQLEIEQMKMGLCQGDIMRTGNRVILAVLVSLLCIGGMCTAATQVAPISMGIQISPESSYLDLDSIDRAASLRQTNTPVRITLTGATPSSMRPIAIYACIPTEEAMRLSDRSSTMATSTLRIRNDRGEWATLQPLLELEGRRGVRIAIVNKASSTILLQVQLQVPTSQVPGAYQGVLTLEAKDR
jgi:hypothetical protein